MASWFAPLILALTPIAAGAAMTTERPMIIPGGQLDPAFPNADVYVGTPDHPAPPPGRACALAARAQTTDGVFGAMRQQVKADVAMLREVSAS